MRAWAGPSAQAAEAPAAHKDEHSQAGFTLLENRPVLVEDLGAEKRFSDIWLSDHPRVSSGASVIIAGESGPYGVLSVHSRQPARFNRSHLRVLQNIATILGASVDRYRQDEAVRLARDQFAEIVEGVGEAITVQKKNGELLFANHAAARMLGFPSVDALIRTPVQEVAQNFQILTEDGEPFPLEKLPGRLALQGMTGASATIRFRILAVNIFRDISALKKRERVQKVLAEAGNLLSSSLDYSATLANVARLAVTDLADWCTVHVIEEDQSVKQLAVAHVDPGKVEMALEYQQRYPPDFEAPTGVGNVLRTGQAEFYPQITDEMIVAAARSEEHLRLIRELGLKSVIILPLNARGRTLGAITLIWAESGHIYTQEDTELLEELANRAAIDIDNARLYQEAQRLNEELELRVTRRTNRLQQMVKRLKDEIGERSRAEQELRAAQVLLTNLFESAPDAVILVDTSGRIVRLNQQGETMFGYLRAELLGKSVDILLPAHLSGRHSSLRSAYFKDKRLRPMGIDLELFARRKDGQEFPVEIMLSPVHTQEGAFVISAIRDITERKILQAELAEVHRRLIENVEAERLSLSRELHDRPIQDLYGVNLVLNHLRNQIADVDSLLQVNGLVQEIKQVIDNLRDICGELRPPSLTPFGLEKAIRTHAESLSRNRPELRINLSLVSDKQELDERVRLALFRVYQNAIHNAIRHAQAQLVEVRFTFDSERVVLEVEDDGQGFNLPKRWVDFARKGHFGLIGTAERMEALGGHLDVVTAPGRGTLIRASLPRLPAGQDAPRSFLHQHIPHPE